MKKFLPFATSKIWQFTDPDTGFIHTGRDKPDLIKKILGYRDQNDLDPIDQLGAVVDNYLCELPINLGSCKNYKLERGFLKYIKGGIALLINMAYDKFVSQDEADRRSSICLGCPHNIFPDKGGFITWADEMAKSAIGDRKSKFHKELGNCSVCSCPLRAKVFFGGKLSLSKQEMIEMPEFCWQKQEVLKNG